MSERDNARAQREVRESGVSRVAAHPAETLAERAIRRYVLTEELRGKAERTGHDGKREDHEKPGEG